jgi:hypothetical protein
VDGAEGTASGSGGRALLAGARRGRGGRAGESVRDGGLTGSSVLGAGAACLEFGASLCAVTCSAGLDSCNTSVEVFFTSSGRRADVATGALWDESGREWLTSDSAETHAVATSAGSSDGERKVSFRGSASSGEETRRLARVGDSSGFTVTGDSWGSEEEDGDTLAWDSGTEVLRLSAPLSVGAGVCILDRFRLGRGGGVSDLGPGELLGSGGATKRRFSGSGSARLSLSLSPQPGTRSKPKDEATPQNPDVFGFLRGGTGGLSPFGPAISLCRGGCGT